ncbi:MAG TPA: hypothetical protein VH079_16645 [Terriglobales bacterium]|nr:hypothetical protein [Terriglobales bacterium]
MLHKCANPPCVTLFRSMHEGKLFKVESEPREKDSQYSTPGLRKEKLPRMEHYWLCDRCFPLVTLTFTKGIGLIMVPLVPPQVAPATLKKSVNSLRLGEVLPQKSGGRQEMA